MKQTFYAKPDLTVDGDCWKIPLNDNEEVVNVVAYVRWGEPPEFDVYGLAVEGHYMEAGDETFEAIYKNRRERIDTLIKEMWSYHIREIERFSESPKTVPPRWID